MSEDQLAIFLPDNRTAFRPGETLRVTVLWALAKEARALEVRLFWRTQGKGSADVEIVATHRMTDLTVSGEKVFDFPLPAGPWSFSGTLISLGWGVEAVAEPDGQNARCDFVLGPGAREILLTPFDHAARA